MDINAAIAQAPESGDGFDIPAGRVEQNLQLRSNMTLRGKGRGTVIVGSMSWTALQWVCLEDLTLLVPSATTLLKLSGCFNNKFHRVTFQGLHGRDFQQWDSTGLELRDNSGQNVFDDCDFINLGAGIRTSCIQNELKASRVGSCGVGLWGDASRFNAGLSVSQTEFMGSAAITLAHVAIDVPANAWSFSQSWFEGSRVGLRIGKKGVGGPAQLGMENCQIAATEIDIDLQYAQQTYLANVRLGRDPGANPVPIHVDPQGCPEGQAINVGNGMGWDIPLSTYPRGWNVLGRGVSRLAGAVA